jgi:hypothetical protein
MLSIVTRQIMLSVVMLGVVMLSVIILSVVMLSFIMLSVVAPLEGHHLFFTSEVNPIKNYDRNLLIFVIS